jgi:hypothetical protein
MTRARRIAHEVAEASRATVQGSKPRDPRELVATARTLERLLARRRKLRREVRQLDAQIKHERKFLKALAGAEFPDDKMPKA